MGAYASVLFVLGMVDRLGELAGPASDVLGVSLEDERLPKRIRLPRRKEEKRRTETDEGEKAVE